MLAPRPQTLASTGTKYCVFSGQNVGADGAVAAGFNDIPFASCRLHLKPCGSVLPNVCRRVANAPNWFLSSVGNTLKLLHLPIRVPYPRCHNAGELFNPKYPRTANHPLQAVEEYRRVLESPVEEVDDYERQEVLTRCGNLLRKMGRGDELDQLQQEARSSRQPQVC